MNRAEDAIRSSMGSILRRSSVYETAAWGIEDQPDFLNRVLVVETALTPQQILETIRDIETRLSRQRSVKWGQRTLDIDILFYNDEIIETKELHIPHPHLQERRFTLEPLNEIEPELRHPLLRKTIRELLEECSDELTVRKIDEA